MKWKRISNLLIDIPKSDARPNEDKISDVDEHSAFSFKMTTEERASYINKGDLKMPSFISEASEKRVQQIALVSAIIHLLLGMSCIIIIIMYNSIFWIYYLFASAPNYAVSVLLLHGIKHKNQRSVKLWIVYNALQIVFCILLFFFTCYHYYSIDYTSRGNGTRTNDSKHLTDSVMVQKIKIGAILDAATAMIFILIMSTCCNMVFHYHAEMKMDRQCSRKRVPEEQQKEAIL